MVDIVRGGLGESVHAAVDHDVRYELSDRSAGEVGRQRHAQIVQIGRQTDLLLLRKEIIR